MLKYPINSGKKPFTFMSSVTYLCWRLRDLEYWLVLYKRQTMKNIWLLYYWFSNWPSCFWFKISSNTATVVKKRECEGNSHTPAIKFAWNFGITCTTYHRALKWKLWLIGRSTGLLVTYLPLTNAVLFLLRYKWCVVIRSDIFSGFPGFLRQ